MNFAVDAQLRGENGVFCKQDFLARSANTCNFVLQKMKIKAPRGGLGKRRNLLIFLRDKRTRRAGAGMAFAVLKQTRNPVEGKRIAVSVPGQTGFPSDRFDLTACFVRRVVGFYRVREQPNDIDPHRGRGLQHCRFAGDGNGHGGQFQRRVHGIGYWSKWIQRCSHGCGFRFARRHHDISGISVQFDRRRQPEGNPDAAGDGLERELHRYRDG